MLRKRGRKGDFLKFRKNNQANEEPAASRETLQYMHVMDDCQHILPENLCNINTNRNTIVKKKRRLQLLFQITQL